MKSSFRIFILGTILLTSIKSIAEYKCSVLLTGQFDQSISLEPSSRDLLRQVIALSMNSPTQIKGQRSDPHIVKKLEDLRPFVERLANRWKHLSAEQRQMEKARILSAIQDTPQLRDFFSYKYPKTASGYAVSQSDLERESYNRILSLIRELPIELRFIPSRPPYDMDRHRDAVAAEKLLSNEESYFGSLFARTEGKTYEDYVKGLRESSDPLIKKALTLIDEKAVSFVIRRHETRREAILYSGFINQFVTGTSSGSLSPDTRNKTESLMMGQDTKVYSGFDDDLKPKYGTLMVINRPDIQNDFRAAASYGEDIYVLKKASVENRLTFYPVDSLGHEAGLFSVGFLGVTPTTDTNWTSRFIPWKFSYLMVPFMMEDMNVSKFSRGVLNDSVKQNPPIFLKAFDIKAAPTPSGWGPPAGTASTWGSTAVSGFPGLFYTYWEIQIWGHLDLSAVEKLIFTVNPPSGRYLLELRRRNIEILDGRYSPPRPWDEIAPPPHP